MKNISSIGLSLSLLFLLNGCKMGAGLNEKQLKDFDSIETFEKVSQVQSDVLNKLTSTINVKELASKVWCFEGKTDENCVKKITENLLNAQKRKAFDDKVIADLKASEGLDKVPALELKNTLKEIYNLSNAKDLNKAKAASASKEAQAMLSCMQHDFVYTVSIKAPEPVPMPEVVPAAEGAEKPTEAVEIPAPEPVKAPEPFKSCYKNVLSPVGEVHMGKKAE